MQVILRGKISISTANLFIWLKIDLKRYFSKIIAHHHVKQNQHVDLSFPLITDNLRQPHEICALEKIVSKSTRMQAKFW